MQDEWDGQDKSVFFVAIFMLCILYILFYSTFDRLDLLIIFLYLRGAGPYISVSLVSCANDAFWSDLAAGYFESCRYRAVLEEAFARAERDGDDH